MGQVGRVSLRDAYHRLRNYDRLLGRTIFGNEIVYYVDALVESGAPGVADSLLAIAEATPAVSSPAISGAIELRSPHVGMWLKRNADVLSSRNWHFISAAVQRAQWRDSTVMALLMEEALHGAPDQTRRNDTFKARRNAVLAFSDLGRLDEAETIAQLADTTVSPRLRWSALGVLSRFDHPPFNRRIRTELEQLDEAPIWLREELEEHQRYDFLPELQAIEDRLSSSVSDYERKWLRESIEYLEEKKAEGAPLGVPLDWPETTWDDKDVNEAESKE